MTTNILIDSEIDGNSRLAVGAKAAVLGELMKQGLLVPPFCVISSGVLANILQRMGNQEHRSGKASPIKGEPLDVELPDGFTMTLEQGLAHIRKSDQDAVAVRSSAIEEDGETASFAGQFETVLGLRTMPEITAAVRTCWASLLTERAETYRKLHSIERSVGMAVIVQRLIEPDSSGVLFTIDPVAQSSNEMVIEASVGFGAAIVQGLLTPDLFKVDRRSWTISSRTLGSKKRMCVLDNGGPVSIVSTPDHLRAAFSLRDVDVLQLVQLGRRIESIMRCPQNIEWAIQRGQVHILQSRPLSARQGM